ncbi:MAG TPA: thiamine phosphate synthase [Xanthobacteraceae bacterium]|nr:thiamine phosphate synthase [Xanthobacteraceae bacterium]
MTRTDAPRQRLYLVTPRIEDPASFAHEVDQALAAGDVAAVLLRLADGDERKQIDRVKTIASVVQRRDVALLLDGYPEVAARAGADGAHISGIEAFVTALAVLKPDRIAGAGGLHSRHDAMLAGESGADYVMFGEPDRRAHRLPFEELEERLVWWAELLEIPCVGYAGHSGEVAALARTGADFVALGEWIWKEPQGVAAAIAAAAENLAAPVPR